METINNNILRVGNITSSEIAAIMKFGKAKGSFGVPALTYIEECNFERRLGRSISTESNARPLTWGSAIEKRVFDLLGIEYQLVSNKTIVHPDIDYWSGSPDANKFDEGKTVVDIKAPLTLKSFCQLVDPLYSSPIKLDGNTMMTMIRDNHKDGDKYYWQLVSNAILTDSKYAELIVYVPYESELQAIQDMITQMDDEKQYRYKWIAFADQDELPSLKDGGYYKNINVIRFEVPNEDKVALTERVRQCSELLESRRVETLSV